MRHHPDWLKVRIPGGKNYANIRHMLRSLNLHTICEEAKCPNIAECFESGTAVFLILGDICTRNCSYCNVKSGKPEKINPNEPKNIAISIKKLGLRYAVITSVTRDDLADGGAIVFYNTVKMVKKLVPNCKIETLIPDFNGRKKALSLIIDSNPDVINHNIEVVRQLFPTIRRQGNYKLSINLFRTLRKLKKNIITKSGFMIGFGENINQIVETMKDLRKVRVDFLTIGQYLQPSRNHIEIKKYYTPEEFLELKSIGLELGFKNVESGPLVRSSYHAQNAFYQTIF
jgi:lipoic acid synthetase